MASNFLGYTGFRFPICHFPVDNIKVSDMSIHLWNIIAKLSDYGFSVDYILQDGGEENRQFIKSQLSGDPLEVAYVSTNILDPTKRIVHSLPGLLSPNEKVAKQCAT